MSMSSPFTEAWLAGPQSTKFYTRTYTAPGTCKAVVVFVHGFAEHIARYNHFHPLYLDHGISVFAFDQRGFGRTAQDKDNKSKDSAYGKTCWKNQMEDIAWAIDHVKTAFPGLPVFLMGHSMGGCEVLGFATGADKTPRHAVVASLSGIISTSPLVKQAVPASKLLRMAGSALSNVAPNALMPADVNPSELSHDPTVGEAYLKDPLVRCEGSLRHISDMLSAGENLLGKHYKNWPQNLPVLIIHGTKDKVTSHLAAQQLYDKLPATNKKVRMFEEGFHELHNESGSVPGELLSEVVAFIEANLTKVDVTPDRSKL